MRLREILSEDYDQDLTNEVNNILVGAKAAGILDVNTETVVRQLQKMGFSVSTESLISVLQDNPIVQNVSTDGIVLTGGDGTASVSPGDDSAAQVGALAQKATEKGMK